MSLRSLENRLEGLGVEFVQNAKVCSPLLDTRARLAISPTGTQLSGLLPCLKEEGVEYAIVGSGSNTLLTGTEEFPLTTAIIKTNRLREFSIEKTGKIIAEAGVPIARVAKLAANASFTGLEFARDIPGTTAGAVITDAWHPIHNYEEMFAALGLDYGSFSKHVSTVLRYAGVVAPSGEVQQMTPTELGMDNRTSILAQPGNDSLLLSAEFSLQPGEPNNIRSALKAVAEGRRAMRDRNKQANPLSVGRTLGYSFVLHHPDYGGASAIELIRTAGELPGTLTIEGMYHSKATPNIICNDGTGTAEGYLRVAEQIQTAVQSEHGISMPLEIRVIK